MGKPVDSELTQRTAARFGYESDWAAVRIGGHTDVDPVFRPGLRASKWGGRHWLDVESVGVEAISTPKLHDKTPLRTVEATSTWRKGGKKKSRVDLWYEGPVRSTEWEVWYDELPDDPIRFLLSLSLGTVAEYQPPLAKWQIDAGHVQDDGAADSYAIYAPVQGRIVRPDGTEVVNYETGKVGHVYCPKWVAADGESINATHRLRGTSWEIDPPAGEWSEKHKGPWILDPTIGYTGTPTITGQTSSRLDANGLFVASESGVVQSISLYCGVGGVAKLALYADSTSYPGSRVDYTGEITADVAWGWKTANAVVGGAVTGGASYWVSCFFGSPGINLKYESSAGTSWKYKAVTYADPPNPYPSGASTLSNYRWGIYATTEAAPTGKLWLPAYLHIQRRRHSGA